MPRQTSRPRYSVRARLSAAPEVHDRMPHDAKARRRPAPPSCWSSCWPSPGASTGSPPRSPCAKCRPGALRVAGSGIGAVTLFAAAIITGHKLKVPRGEVLHVMVAGFFNVAAFQILSGFAQLSGATIARDHHHLFDADLDHHAELAVLGEQSQHASASSRSCLCVAGLTILLWPLFADGIPLFVFYSLGCALSWASRRSTSNGPK